MGKISEGVKKLTEVLDVTPEGKATFYSSGQTWSSNQKDFDLYENEEISIEELKTRSQAVALLRD
jgi:hypothetical protein